MCPHRIAQTAPPAARQSSSGGKRTVRSGTTTLFFIDVMASLVINANVFRRFFSHLPSSEHLRWGGWPCAATAQSKRRRQRPSKRRHGASATVRSGTTTLFFIDLMASLVTKLVAPTCSSRSAVLPRLQRKAADPSLRSGQALKNRSALPVLLSGHLRPWFALPDSQCKRHQQRPRAWGRVRPRQFVLQRL